MLLWVSSSHPTDVSSPIPAKKLGYDLSKIQKIYGKTTKKTKAKKKTIDTLVCIWLYISRDIKNFWRCVMQRLGNLTAVLFLFCYVVAWGCAIGDESTGSAKLKLGGAARQQQEEPAEVSTFTGPTGNYYFQNTEFAKQYILKQTQFGGAEWGATGLAKDETTFVLQLDLSKANNSGIAKLNIKTKDASINADCESIEIPLGFNDKGEYGGQINKAIGTGHDVYTSIKYSKESKDYEISVAMVEKRSDSVFEYSIAEARNPRTSFVSEEKMMEDKVLNDSSGDDKLKTKAKAVQQAFGSGSNCGGSPSGGGSSTPIP